VRATVKQIENGDDIVIPAITYFEPIARFAILIDCDTENISINCKSDGVRAVNSMNDVTLDSGLKCNALLESVSRGLAPKFPYRVEIKHKQNHTFQLLGIMRAISDEEYQTIPCQLIY
jgi:hypothetical protein